MKRGCKDSRRIVMVPVFEGTVNAGRHRNIPIQLIGGA
jgi:hypothetical protein